MSETYEFEGNAEATIVTGQTAALASIVIRIIIQQLKYSSFVIIESTSSSVGVKNASFEFSASAFHTFDNPALLSFTTTFADDNDENSLQIGTGVIDIRKLAKCKYISIELSTHSLKTGDDAVSLVLVAKRLKKKLK